MCIDEDDKFSELAIVSNFLEWVSGVNGVNFISNIRGCIFISSFCLRSYLWSNKYDYRNSIIVLCFSNSIFTFRFSIFEVIRFNEFIIASKLYVCLYR